MPAKGQILVVREAGEEAEDELEAFLSAERLPRPLRGSAWVGRLAGSIVAVATTVREERSLVLDQIHVGRDLRRKNIGRYMIREIRRLAGDGNKPAILEIAADCVDHPFFAAIEQELG